MSKIIFSRFGLMMVIRYAFRSIYIISLILFSKSLIAQPNLPDLAAVSKDGVNILTWNCQYEGLKSITVKRAKDSLGAYAAVGNVKELKKGIQVFADGHPMPGNNWYQLTITFQSNLTWNSNKIRLHVDSSTLIKEKVVLPPNDSLQQFVRASESTERSRREKRNGEQGGKIVAQIDPTQKGVVSSETATNNSDGEIKKGPKITISLGNMSSDLNPLGYMKAEHVYTDPLSGHIKIEVPDVKRYTYSLKFYNEQNVAIIEVPKLTASPVIMDKRNFNKKGVYKFVLKRNNAEYETGYVTIY